MADYPDWVLRHKKKGTYVNCVKGRYYLYAAHSERVPGTKKVRRVSDGYIGRITEEDGLIPARDRLGAEVRVYEFGLCMAILGLCGGIYAGLKRSSKEHADWHLVAGMLSAAYGERSRETYEWSYLSLRFPGLDMGGDPPARRLAAAERCGRMAEDVFRRRFGDGCAEARARLSRIFMVKAGGRLYRSSASAETKEWLESNGIELEA